MERFHTIQASVFLSLILLMIIAVINVKQKNPSFSTRLFLLVCWSTLLALFADMGTWLSDGIPGGNRRWIPYIINFVLFLLQPLPLSFWFCYVDFLLNKSIERLKKRWYYLPPFVVTAAVMVYSVFTGYVFRIDGMNRYTRGPGVIVISVINVLLILFSFYLPFRYRHTADKRVLRVVAFFGVIPLIGGFFQILHYGVSLIWPSVAVTIIYVYIFLETQREIRDYLTGLLNRQQIDDIIQSRMRDYGRKGEFALVMIDMDGFKKINDQYGHAAGDDALIHLSAILRNTIKSVDKAARFGGDEFLLLIENDNPEKIEQIIRRIQARIHSANEKRKKPFNIAISAGYRIYSPKDYPGLIDLLHAVDQEMYTAKKRREIEA